LDFDLYFAYSILSLFSYFLTIPFLFCQSTRILFSPKPNSSTFSLSTSGLWHTGQKIFSCMSSLCTFRFLIHLTYCCSWPPPQTWLAGGSAWPPWWSFSRTIEASEAGAGCGRGLQLCSVFNLSTWKLGHFLLPLYLVNNGLSFE
jgi:hypothetical protein